MSSSLLCALSGSHPETPVLSKTGYLFEKSVITKYLKANGDVCPVTGEPLTVNDLTEIKVSKYARPRPAAAASIPGLLMSLQNEWDSLMTETFNLRAHLDTVRNQLSHSLYQHDAACRVVARLLRERDGLRQELAQFQREAGACLSASDTQKAMALEELGFSPAVIDELQAYSKTLLAQRKKRDLSEVLSSDRVATYREKASYTPHSSTVTGVTRCLVHPSGDNSRRLVWTAGVDGAVHLFDLDLEKTVGRLHGHMKQVNAMACHWNRSNVSVTASDDKTIRVWVSLDGAPEGYKMSHLLRNHTKAVTSVSIHPTGQYFAASSKDLTWAIYDLDSGRTCRSYRHLPSAMPVVAFHPDGMLIGACGMNSQIYIYDVKSGCDPVVALSGHDTPVTDLQFSENGYYLATASACLGGTVKLWDLRKSSNFCTVEPVNQKGTPFIPHKITFDRSGMYLAVSGGVPSASDATKYDEGCVSVYHFASKTELKQLTCLAGHTNLATDASFGSNGTYLVSTSMDRTVKVWEPTS